MTDAELCCECSVGWLRSTATHLNIGHAVVLSLAGDITWNMLAAGNSVWKRDSVAGRGLLPARRAEETPVPYLQLGPSDFSMPVFRYF